MIIQKINLKKQELRELGEELNVLADELNKEIWHVDFPMTPQNALHPAKPRQLATGAPEEDETKKDPAELVEPAPKPKLRQPRHTCCGSRSTRHRLNCPKKTDDPKTEPAPAPVESQKPISNEPLHIRYGECEHTFYFRGELMDARCPECQSLECFELPD